MKIKLVGDIIQFIWTGVVKTEVIELEGLRELERNNLLPKIKNMKNIKKYDIPSLVRRAAYTKARSKLVDYLIEKEAITKDEAEFLADNEEAFQKLLRHGDMLIQKKMQDEMIPLAMEAYKRKVETGSMEQAQRTVTAIAILKDKAIGQDKYSAPVQIAGQNVQVNLSWKPKWMKK